MTLAIANTSDTRRDRGVARTLRERAEDILRESFAFIDSPKLRARGAEARLFNANAEPRLPATDWYQPTTPEFKPEKTGHIPKIMGAADEPLMFLRYNFAKLRLSQLQRKARREGLTSEMAEQVIEWRRRLEHYREYLVRANLGLVLAMTRRYHRSDTDYFEIISEGNMALLRAVDKFNVDRGFKFSTYACRAILKAFGRTAMKQQRHHARFPVEFQPDMEQSDWVDKKRDIVQEQNIDELKQIVNRNLADLSDTEQMVIRSRFNWEQQEESPLTLEEVGRIIGLTKERVRQIQNKALAKIRRMMEDDQARMRSASASESGQSMEE